VPDCKPGEYISRERWGIVGGLSADEQMSHLALWAILAAPLILGNDPRNMDAFTRSMLTAPGVLAIAQDANVAAGRRSWRENGAEVWRRTLSDGSVALLLLNRRGNATADVAALWHRDVAPPTAAPPGCVDVEVACADRAANGECTANARYMQRKCNASCPDLCRAALEFQGTPPAEEEEEQTPLPAGRELHAHVVDAWTGKRVGVFARGIAAHGLLPHASRLLRVTLVDAPPEPEPQPQPLEEEEEEEEGDEEEPDEEQQDEPEEEEEEEDESEDSSLSEPPPPSRRKRKLPVPRKTKQPRRRAAETDAADESTAGSWHLGVSVVLMVLAQCALLIAVLRSIRRVLRKRRKRQHRS
jgi:hypothetical protein